MKKFIRVIGFDDMPFNKFKDKRTRIIGTIFRGKYQIEGFLSISVKVDGDDSTKKIINVIERSKFKSQLRAIFTDGIAFGGFNIFDPYRIYEKLKIPVIIICRKKPDIKRIKNVLKRLKKEKEIKIIDKVPEPKAFSGIYYQNIGIDDKKTKELISLFRFVSLVPEPIRISHLIGQALKYRESKGNV